MGWVGSSERLHTQSASYTQSQEAKMGNTSSNEAALLAEEATDRDAEGLASTSDAQEDQWQTFIQSPFTELLMIDEPGTQ